MSLPEPGQYKLTGTSIRIFYNNTHTGMVHVPRDSVITVTNEALPSDEGGGGSVIGLYNNNKIKIYVIDVPYLTKITGGHRKRKQRKTQKQRKQKTNRKSRRGRRRNYKNNL